MRFTTTMQTRSRVCTILRDYEYGFKWTVFFTVAATAEFAKTGKGLITHTCANIARLSPPRWLTLTISVVEVGVKWRPGPSELVELGPKFKEVWDLLYANAPDKPVLWTGIFSACMSSNRNQLPQRKYFTMATRTVSTTVLAMPAEPHQT